MPKGSKIQTPNLLYYTNRYGVDFVHPVRLTGSELVRLADRLTVLEDEGLLKGWSLSLSPVLGFAQAMEAIEREATDPIPRPASS